MSFVLSKAGDYAVQLTLADGKGSLQHAGTCLPSVCAAAACVVVDAPARLAAGEPAEMRVLCKDKCVLCHACGWEKWGVSGGVDERSWFVCGM